jgi:nucleotide-binding universal stress UspA family protein
VDKIIKKNTDNAHQVLEIYKNEMVRMGISEDRIETVTKPRKQGLAKDILDHGQQGWYDAIVVGRRGLTRLQETFMGSVSNNLIEHSGIIPVWLVGGQVTFSKIMIAVDGSESSLRAVDHLSFMIGKNPDARFTIFHVIPKGKYAFGVDFSEDEQDMEELMRQTDKEIIDRFYSVAFDKFKEAGIGENQIKIKMVERNSNPGKAIIKQAEKKDFGTIVIGRRGINKAFFMGSVSRYVISRISNRALWLVS